MPQIRFSASTLGKYIEPKIETFLRQNVEYMKNKNNTTYKIGNKTIANAIAYGVSITLSSPIMRSSFAIGIAPPPVMPSLVTVGGPIGQWIYAVLKPNVVET